MMRNNLKKTVLYKKIFLKKKYINKISLKKLSKIYYLTKSNFMFIKFNTSFFKFYFYILKKLNFFFKRNVMFYIFQKNLLNTTKFFYGNLERLHSSYFFSDIDQQFFRINKKKNLTFQNNILVSKNYFHSIGSINFFSIYNTLIDIDCDKYDFFYKGSIYENLIFELENDFYLFFLKNFNLEYIFDYNLLYIIEIYKINILFVILKIK